MFPWSTCIFSIGACFNTFHFFLSHGFFYVLTFNSHPRKLLQKLVFLLETSSAKTCVLSCDSTPCNIIFLLTGTAYAFAEAFFVARCDAYICISFFFMKNTLLFIKKHRIFCMLDNVYFCRTFFYNPKRRIQLQKLFLSVCWVCHHNGLSDATQLAQKKRIQLQVFHTRQEYMCRRFAEKSGYILRARGSFAEQFREHGF